MSLGTAFAAGPFTPGNVVIYRVGDGSASITSSATAIFLDEYTPTGTLVQSIALPTAANGSNHRLTGSGTATSEGLISLSADGKFLIVAGYDAAPGTASITSSTSATINRVIARVDASGNIDTTTALTDAISGGNPRSAASTDGTTLYISGTSSGGGIRYAAFGATTSTALATSPTNLRAVNIFNGQLYVSSQSGTTRVAAVGTGTPTTAGQTIANLPGYTTSTTSPYGFFFADLDSNTPGLDTLYVADDNASGGTGGVQKYSLVGGSWVANGFIPSTGGLRGITGTVAGGIVTLYISGSTGSNGTLYTLSDNTGYNATISGTLTTLATASANKGFRGIAFVPTGNTPTNPAGFGSASPSSVQAGQSTLLKVLVAAGTNPLSSGLVVTADLSSIGGSSTQQFFDDGTHGDVTAGDNNYSFSATLPVATSTGPKLIPVTISDAQMRTGATSISLTVTSPATPPTGTGAAQPSLVSEGDTPILFVNTTPGANPTSTGITVTGDLSSIGGSATQQFYDDGTHGDMTAGDGSFAYSISIPSGSAPGGRSLPITVADAQGRSSITNISLTVKAPPPPTTVKISQVYGGGGNSGSTYTNDFFEIFNTSTVPVNLTGWTIQYTGSTTGTWTPTTLCQNGPCSIGPGQYMLIQQSAGAGGTTSLPTPDASGSILVSSTQGKVALVASTVALSGTCPTDATIVDMVGYGPAATCFEGAPTGATTNTTAVVRKNNGCVDTNNNSQDFRLIGPVPRNSASPTNYCGGDPARMSGVGTATPNAVLPASNALLTVAVNPATNPASTNIKVQADLTQIGGDQHQPFYEDATHGDQIAGDNTFSFEATIAPFVSTGVKNILATITDDEEDVETAPITLTVQSPTCGVERWSVKVGVDPDAQNVNLSNPIPTSIADLISIPLPFDPNVGPPDNARVAPYENNVYTFNATMTLFKLETDVDYHIVMTDDQGRTMITEVPSPACIISSTPPRVPAPSPFSAAIAKVREYFDSHYMATTFFQPVSVPVRVTGVAFFDFIHGQTGVAPNGIELHPILDLQFLNPTTSTLVSNVNPAELGQAITFMVGVTAASGPTPTGTVTLYDGAVSGGTLLGTAPLNNGVAMFTIANLAPGQHTIVAQYGGDTNSATSTSNSLSQTVNGAISGSVNLITTATLTKLADGSYQATLRVNNKGTGTALNVVLTNATLGSATGSPLPQGPFNVPPNGFATLVMNFPASAGVSGSASIERFSGTFSGGSFAGSLRVTLP